MDARNTVHMYVYLPAPVCQDNGYIELKKLNALHW